MDIFYILTFLSCSNFIYNNKIPKIYKNILKNQFIKLFVLIFLFNIILHNEKIGILLTIIFLMIHNHLHNVSIDNNII